MGKFTRLATKKAEMLQSSSCICMFGVVSLPCDDFQGGAFHWNRLPENYKVI